VTQRRLLLLGFGGLLWLVAAGPLVQPATVAAQPAPTAVQGQSVTSPLDTPAPVDTPTPTPTPSPTVTATPTETATATATPTATSAPFQISPLVVQPSDQSPDTTGALLWIAAAALIILAGSVIMLLADRRDKR